MTDSPPPIPVPEQREPLEQSALWGAPAPVVRLMTAAEVAELLGGDPITATTVKRSYKRWHLEPVRVGKHLRWSPATVEAWMQSHTTQ